MRDNGDAAALLARMRSLRKRRGTYRSNVSVEKEIDFWRSLLPPHSVERAIFEAAEVEGRSYKAIAAELNISERHLYRMRHRMIGMIAAGEAAARPSAARSAASADFEVVWTLLKYGHVERAKEALAATERRHLEPGERVEALSLRSRIAIDCGDRESARRWIAQARSACAAVDPAGRRQAERVAGLSESYAHYVLDAAYERAIAVAERVLGGVPDGTLRLDELPAVGRDLVFLGMLYQEADSPERAITVLERAERVLLRAPVHATADIAMTHVHRALASASLCGGEEAARAHSQRALALSAAAGAPFETVWARLVSGLLKEQIADVSGADGDMRAALDVGGAVFYGDPLVRTHFHAVRADVAAGRASAALDRIATVRAHLLPGTLLEVHFSLVSARLHYARRDFVQARRFATAAIEGFESRTASTHFIGVAYLTRAAAARNLGLDARADAASAVSYLRRGGYVADQLASLRLFAEIKAS